REFLLDEAPGSLMAGLRQRRLAGDVALNWLYQDSAPRLAGAGAWASSLHCSWRSPASPRCGAAR
ncbi:hypothetical protein, partial [Klebsiella pneumoniae]|uniref:hypothetical protein n=1 Tax=Klebsiella pneumoniae TaxID=573 RepID=UPI001D0E821F